MAHGTFEPLSRELAAQTVALVELEISKGAVYPAPRGTRTGSPGGGAFWWVTPRTASVHSWWLAV